MFYEASAPANLMIMGEYAVLSGHSAVVCAVNQRLHCQITPRNDQKIQLRSQLGEAVLSTHNLEADKPFDLAAACLRQYPLNSGCDIVIHSEFSHLLGLGSSAALVAALCHCLAQWTERKTDTESLWKTGMLAIRSLYPNSSGADLAASLSGGMVEFKNQPLSIRNLQNTPEIAVVYSGSKLATPAAVQSYQQQKQNNPTRIAQYIAETQKLTSAFIACAQLNDWEMAGETLNQAHHQMCILGVSTNKLNRLAGTIRHTRGIHGAKISGSGYGDCLIAFGQLPKDFLTADDLAQGCLQLDLQIESQGVLRETT